LLVCHYFYYYYTTTKMAKQSTIARRATVVALKAYTTKSSAEIAALTELSVPSVNMQKQSSEDSIRIVRWLITNMSKINLVLVGLLSKILLQLILSYQIKGAP
jgi:hypothetical protein